MQVRPVGNHLAAAVHTAVLAASATVAAATFTVACTSQLELQISNSCYKSIKCIT